VFQLHGVDERGKIVLTERLRRDGVLTFFANLPACVVGMEACASGPFWAREISKPGHTVRLMPPQYVKPCAKRHKNDQADAEAICEAVQRPNMRFVPIKSEDKQSTLVIHPVRETLVRQRTQLINALRGHLAEFGIVASQGAQKVTQLTMRLAEPGDEEAPAAAKAVLQGLVEQLRDTERRIDELDAQLVEQAKRDGTCRRLLTVPGIGPIVATGLPLLDRMLLDQPLTRPAQLQPRAVHPQVNGPAARARRFRQRHRRGAARDGGVVRHRQIQPEQVQEGADHPFGLAQRQTEDSVQHEGRRDREVGVAGLPARRRPWRRLPLRDRLAADPERQAAVLAKRYIVLRPVENAPLRPQDVVTVSSIRLVGHGR
jgi:hypothetical protein